MTEEPLLKHFVGKKMGLKGAVAGLSKKRDMKAQLWVFGVPPKKMAAKAVNGAATPDVGSVQATINLASGLNLNLALETDPKFAQDMVVKFGEEKTKLTQNPMMMMMGLGPVITKSQLTANGKDLTLASTCRTWSSIINMVKMMTQKKAGAAPGAPGAPGMPMLDAAPYPGRSCHKVTGHASAVPDHA